MKATFTVVSLIIMLVGLAGTVLPVLPGLLLIYLGYLLYGLFTSWQSYGAGTMVFWGVVVAASLLIEYYAGVIGAKRSGASIFGMWGSMVGAVAGVLLFSFPGLVIGTFAGAVVGEMAAGRTVREALKSGKGAIIGFFAGTLFKLVVGLIMIGTFIWQILTNFNL